jgi:predicted amidohydrolase YtcJ
MLSFQDAHIHPIYAGLEALSVNLNGLSHDFFHSDTG